MVIPSWLSAWPGKLEPFKGYPSTHGNQIGPCMNKASVKADDLTSGNGIHTYELLVYCCICRMAMKNETWNCACIIRPLLANLVITCNYIYIQPRVHNIYREESILLQYTLYTCVAWSIPTYVHFSSDITLTRKVSTSCETRKAMMKAISTCI